MSLLEAWKRLAVVILRRLRVANVYNDVDANADENDEALFSQ